MSERRSSTPDPVRSARRRLLAVPTAVLLSLSLLLGVLTSAARDLAAPTPAAAYTRCDEGPNACWMARERAHIGDTPLPQVVFPLSHDTGTYQINNYSSFAQNQDHSVYQQLVAGVRGLDIRVAPRRINGQVDLYAYHGSVETDVKLSTMLDELVRFTSGAGAEKELINVYVRSYDYSDYGVNVPGIVASACRSYEQALSRYALSPAMAKSRNGAWLSMNELWALPGSPRLMIEWPKCDGVSSFWNAQNWANVNGSYYANQMLTPCVRYADLKSLVARRAEGTEDIPYAYVDGATCWNSANVPAGAQAMTGLGKHVSGLYTLFLQQNGLVPASTLYVQRNVLSDVESAFANNQWGARANLNYLGADFVVNDAGVTNFIPRVIAIDQQIKPLRFEDRSAQSTSGVIRVHCPIDTAKGYTVHAGGLTITQLDDRTPLSGVHKIDNHTADFPADALAIAHCTDSTGRMVRRVHHNRLGTLGTVTENFSTDEIGPVLYRKATLTDAYGHPVAGRQITFTVTKGHASLGSQKTQSATAVTDANGIATIAVHLGTQPGQDVISASTASTYTTVSYAFNVRAGAMTHLTSAGGNHQTVPPRYPFAPLLVKATDRLGYVVPNELITMKVEQGFAVFGNKTTTQTVSTDANGVASIPLTAGDNRSQVVVSATAGGVRLVFNLTVA